MLKNILNLEGAQQLTKNEQKEINGGCVNCAIINCPRCPDGTLPAYPTGTAAQCVVYCQM